MQYPAKIILNHSDYHCLLFLIRRNSYYDQIFIFLNHFFIQYENLTKW